ncbi:ribonuclease E [endosymbiont of Euscepes postfasciatus]|uniref:Rne/Rng family ribonuclease n=1 Tax=endosymbiont of Euscepes postfasciatus TaxID=650377 RepID=UPI000DC714F0|nr:Rne/Rng family ribonuclease [endosymbiont of Euscepes postfasciatus]BBA84638.1 ribonuclease E [endosymbiont of Euscepes postfasciatus]
MKKMLIDTSNEEEIRVALINDNWLYDLYIENYNNKQKKNNIYKGKIEHIENSLESVFVNYGYEKHGFLSLKNISDDYFIKKDTKTINRNINNLYKGQDLLVQVIKEERFNKGAVLTTFISLVGSYIILFPNNSKSFGISKRIDNKNKKILKEILSQLKFPNNMGLIIRTSCVGKIIEDIQYDLNLKIKNWEKIKNIYNSIDSPATICEENNILIKIFRDYLTQDISEIIIDNKSFIKKSKICLKDLGKNDFINKIKFYFGNYRIFSYHNIESQIETAFKRNIRLPSGGVITIDTTEALTAIDINSSKSTKCLDIEETAFKTNLEASNEIARQLRLRDLGGLIIIDFIDMLCKKNCLEIENNFKKFTYQDRAKIKFGNISKFGLLEISRQRLTNSLNESNYYICPRCKGNGFIRNNRSLLYLILRLIEEESLKENTKEIHVIVPILIGTILLNEKRKNINEIEEKRSNLIKIIIIPYDKIKTPNYIITRIKNGEEKNIFSYLIPYIYKKNIKHFKYKNTNNLINNNFLNENMTKINNINKIKNIYYLIKNYIFNFINKIKNIILKKFLYKRNNYIYRNKKSFKKRNFYFFKKNKKINKK